ncbi:MAG: endonuclease/exonuclease/phosphatase family protein [Pseudomonadota bacterium]
MTQLRVVTWNLGFGALGHEASFIGDGGTSIWPSTRRDVKANVQTIVTTLQELKADVYCLQEVSKGGTQSRGVNILSAISEALPQHQGHFEPDIYVLGRPSRMLLPHGLALFTRLPLLAADHKVLGHSTWGGFIQKRHGAQLCALDAGPSTLRLSNLHLEAYTEEEGKKWAAAQRLFDWAKSSSAPTVLAGDWNMLLAPLGTQPDADQSYDISWAVEFPADRLPDGLSLVPAEGVPTNRSVQAPLSSGRCLFSSLDGFVVSDGIANPSAHVVDLGFGPSDHHPVVLDLDL